MAVLSDREVEELLVSTGAILNGHFLLTSGKHAGRYIQCARLLQHPESAQQVAVTLMEEIAPLGGIDAVIGPALGGVIIAYELARVLGVRGMFSEREPGGRMTLRRGFRISPGERLLIVEDVVTTGGSSLEVAQVVEENGGKTVGIACVVDRRPAGTVLSLPVFAAVQMQIPVYAPEDCPLCHRGLPCVKPGSRK